jgi:hypothetical protein
MICAIIVQIVIQMAIHSHALVMSLGSHAHQHAWLLTLRAIRSESEALWNVIPMRPERPFFNHNLLSFKRFHK